MKDFQSAIHTLLKDHKNRKRYLAFLLALSMIVSVAVPFSLIVPAVSMTMSDAEMIYAMDEAPAGATNIATANTITVSLEKYDGSTNWDPDGSASDSADCNFKFEFGFEDLGGVSTAQPYLYYQMPAGLMILNAKEFDYKDTNWSYEKVAGHISISTDGLVIFRLYDDYITDYLMGKGKLSGFFNFDATISRAEGVDGDQILDFSGTKVEIPFKDKELSLEKRGSLDASDENDMRVNWTIDITNQDKTWDLNGYTITDIMLENGKEIQIDPGNAGSFDSTTKVITLNENASNSETIQIKYYTKLDNLNSDITNKAILKDKDGAEKDTDEETVDVGKIVDVTKNGTPDYQIDGAGIDSKIQWTVTIVNQYGHSLDGYILEDALFPEDASEIAPSGLVVKENGVYKLNTTEKEVTLTYWASVAEGNWNNNKIIVKQPGGEPGDEKDIAVNYYKKSDLFNLTKNGNYDKSNHIITWEITVNTQQDNVQSLNGYVLTDAQFKNAINGVTANPPIDFSLTDSALTIHGDTDRVTFTYQTLVTEEIAESANGNNGNVTNDVDLNEPGKPDPVKEVTGSANNVWKFENTFSKTTDDSNQIYYTNGEIKADVKWTVNITKEAGLAGKTFTDTLTLPAGVTDAVLKDLQVGVSTYGGNYQSAAYTGGTLTKNEDGTYTFAVTFDDNIDPKDYYAQLTYTTTVTIPAVGDNAYDPITYTVNNVGNFGGEDSGASANITRENPNKQEDMNVTVGKTWDDDNSPDRPEQITIRLTREVQTKVYDASGELSSSEDWKTDTAFETNGVKEIELTSGTWVYTDQLPKIVSTTSEDGSVTQYYYRYKVEETGLINGKFVTNAEEGYYEAGYSNNGYLTDNGGSVQITNTLHKNELISVGLHKQWSENIPDANMPDSITVQLERYENGSFKEVVDTQVLTGSNWEYTWNELPKQSVQQNGTDLEIIDYAYHVKEVSVEKNGTTYSISNNAFAITENGSYSVAYNKNGINQTDTIEITNTFTPVNVVSIEVLKKWSGNAGQEQPKSITVQLFQKVGYNGDWNPMPNKQIILDENCSWKDAFIDLPTEVLTVNADGTFTKEPCSYKVLECGYDDTPFTGNSFEYGNGSYKVTYSWDGGYNFYSLDSNEMQLDPSRGIQIQNTFEEHQKCVTKSALDKSGNELTELLPDKLSDKLNVIQKDGEDYYVITWMIDTRKIASGENVVDILPDGFELYTGSTLGKDWVSDFSLSAYPCYGPSVLWDGNSGKYSGYDCPSSGQPFYEVNGRQLIYHHSNNGSGYFLYSTIIKKADLEQMISDSPTDLSITNTCTANGDTDTAIVTIKKGSGDVPSEQELLSKTGTGYGENSAVIYKLDVNPEGKILSNDGQFDITDIFSTVRYNEQTGNTLFDANLDYVRVYDAETDIELPAGSWGYQIEYNPSTKTVMDITNRLSYDSNSGYIANWSGITFSDIEIRIRYDGVPNEEVYFSMDGTNKQKEICDENGIAYYTFSLASFGHTNFLIHLYHDSDGNNEFYDYSKMSINSATYTKTEINSVAELTITVPDARHLRVEYCYVLQKDGKELPVGTQVAVNNAASFNTGNASSDATSGEIAMEIQAQEGGTSAVGDPTIVKVDAGNYSINNLNAAFKLAKYDGERWQYLTTMNGASIPADGWGDENEATEIAVNGSYQIKGLESGVLYRLTEIRAPVEQGYESMDSPNFTKDYYFVYNSTNFSYPQNMADKLGTVMQIKAGGNISIPNNKLITIEAEKAWYEAPENWSVDFELYWSYQKASAIPPSAKPVRDLLERFGLPDDYPTTQEVTENKKATWTNLPNGMDGQPIYYYVKEVAYTIGGVKYTWDEASEKFLNGTVEGEYKPHYTNNAANTDRMGEDAIIVTNNKGLVIRKEWLNSDNTEMANPPKPIHFTLYGKNASGKFVVIGTPDEYELNAENGWKRRFENLTGYTEFKVVENAQDGYGYSISYTSAVTDGVGEIKIINKDNTPTEISVDVEKEWADGVELHANDFIDVTLYRVSRSLTDAEYTALQEGTLQLPLSGAVFEQLEVQTLSTANTWKYTWNKLPYKGTETDHPEVSRWFYYPIESSCYTAGTTEYTPVYTATITSSAQRFKIRNTLPGSLQIEKQWQTASEDSVTNVNYDSVTVEVFRRALESSSSEDTPGSVELPASLKVVCLGDSITKGTYNAEYNNEPSYTAELAYPKRLENDYLLKNGYSNVTMVKCAENGMQIEGSYGIKSYTTWDSGLDSNVNAVCIIAGTNDVINTDVPITSDDPNVVTVERKFRNLITAVHGVSPDAVLYVGSIPRFMALTWSDKRGTTQAEWDSAVKDFNDMVEDVVTEFSATSEYRNKICYVDIYQAVGDNLYDGVHPTHVGNDAIANAFYQKINTHYTGSQGSNTSTITTPTNINYCPTNLTTAEKIGEYQITPDESGNWSLNITGLDKANEAGVSYVYYAREKPVDGWEASYEANGQVIGDTSQAITITNTKQDIPIDITVEKKWNDGNNPNRPDTLTLTLQRSTDQQTWTDTDQQMPQPDESGSTWTYTYTGLPSENAEGEKFFYRIVETVPTGYTLSESNNDGISIDSTDKTIKLTNTKTVSLEIEKEWVGGENEYIDVNVYRSTVPNTQEMPLITTTAASGVTTTVVTTTTTTTTTEPTTEETTVETGAANVQITGLKPGDTLTVTLTGGPANAYVNGCYGYAYNEWTQVEWEGHFDSSGNLTLTYQIPETCTEGTHFEFQIWYVDNGFPKAIQIAYEITTPTVKPDPPDPVETKILTDVEASKSVDLSQYDYKKIKAIGIKFGVREGSSISSANFQLQFGGNYKGKDSATLQDGVYIMSLSEPNDSNLVIYNYNTYDILSIDEVYLYYEDPLTSVQTFALRPTNQLRMQVVGNVIAPQAMAADSSAQVGETIRISKALYPDWTYTLENLPAYDENGAVYYYWLEEVSVPGYQTSYSFTDADGNTTYCVNAGQLTDSTGNVKILNTKTDTSGVVMPSTGSTGTAGYTKAGGAIMLMSTAVYILTKRRKKSAS